MIILVKNHLMRSRSIVYKTYETDLEQEVEYEVESQYSEVHKYLNDLNLIYNNEDLFQNKIADHFADFVRPYINEVVSLLPPIQSDNVIALVKYAYTRKI